MNTKRYYVRKILTTNTLVVEKSEILDRKAYIVDVASREDNEPFEMISESSDDYRVSVNAALHSQGLCDSLILNDGRLLEFKSI